MKMNRREFLVGGASLAAGCAQLPSVSDGGRKTVRIVHCGDPQFGFGKGASEDGYRGDVELFERVIAEVNRLQPDLCFIAGDMTDRADFLERDWPRLIRLFKVPFVVAPGNHDMGNNVTRENLERFERVFGYEYKSLKVGQWRFLSCNSQYWRPTEEKARQTRYEAWLADELAKASAAGEPVIIGSHMSPFVRRPDEPDDYENYPKAGRAARLDLYERSGVKFYLSGHTHRLYMRSERGIMMLNAETTCWNFDGRPFGFRLLTLDEGCGYTWDFHGVV